MPEEDDGKLGAWCESKKLQTSFGQAPAKEKPEKAELLPLEPDEEKEEQKEKEKSGEGE